MIEEDLRTYYGSVEADRAIEDRLIAALAAVPTQRPTGRTALVMAASAAAVIAVAAGVLVLPHHDSTQRAAVGAPAEVQVAPTPQVVAQIFSDLVKGHGAVSALNGDDYHGNFVHVRLNFDDGRGAAQISLDVFWPATAPTTGKIQTPEGCAAMNADTTAMLAAGGQITDGRGVAVNPYLQCSTLGDGTELGVSASPAGTAEANPGEVTALLPNGVEVDIDQGTGPQASPGQEVATRSAPPFTQAELIAFATSSQWTPTVPASAVTTAQGLFEPNDMTRTYPVGPTGTLSPSASPTK